MVNSSVDIIKDPRVVRIEQLKMVVGQNPDAQCTWADILSLHNLLKDAAACIDRLQGVNPPKSDAQVAAEISKTKADMGTSITRFRGNMKDTTGTEIVGRNTMIKEDPEARAAAKK